VAPRVYRYGYSPGFFLFIAGMGLVVAISIVIVFPLSPWHLVIVPANMGFVAFSFRMSRMGARIDESGVKVVRMFRTIRVPWSQFRRFVLRPRPQDLLSKTGYVERLDGSMVWIQGMAPWGRLVSKVDDFGVEALVEEMNRVARRLKGTQERKGASS
jgi:hypothetical protein